MASPLMLGEARQIAESIVGNVQWRGAEGYCACPGASKHTTGATPLDLHVVCEPIATGNGTLAPGVYCFHDSCATEVEAASFALRSALGKRCPSAVARPRSPFIMPTRRPKPEFDRAKLERIARKLDGADAEWFAARSPKRPDTQSAYSFLHALYQAGEKVVIFDVFESQGQALWERRELPPYDTGQLDSFHFGKPNGVWFLCNPVTGESRENKKNPDGTAHFSRRFEGVVTSFRYLVLESDKANAAHWLAVLAQMPLPIAAIYMSGGKSIHALVRLDAESKSHWDSEADKIKPALITLGADRKAISAVRLTRLPGCERVEKGAMQTLLYLNEAPGETPIVDMPVIAPGWLNRFPADQDGFDGEEVR